MLYLKSNMNNVIEQFKDGFKSVTYEMMSIDEDYGTICSIASDKYKLRIQSNRTSLSNTPQHMGFGAYSTSVNNSSVSSMTVFFNRFNERMQQLRKERNERIIGKVNLELCSIKTVTEEEKNTIKESANKGFTIIGVKLLPTDKTLSKVDKDKNHKDPISLKLESEELIRLKALRDNIKAMNLEEQQNMKLENGVTLKMKPNRPVSNGFTGAVSLIIFMSILATIVELFIIYAGTLD